MLRLCLRLYCTTFEIENQDGNCEDMVDIPKLIIPGHSASSPESVSLVADRTFAGSRKLRALRKRPSSSGVSSNLLRRTSLPVSTSLHTLIR